MKRVAVIGASGFVGSALVRYIGARHNVVPVDRSGFERYAGEEFDIVINSAMPAARFLAKRDPERDFLETVKKTSDIIYKYRFKKLIQISSVSSRCQLDTIYGRHKLAAESMASYGNNLIVRLGPMFSAALKKGVLIDMIKGQRVYVSERSEYCFASLDFVSEFIANNLDKEGIIEVGAKNGMKLRDVASHLGSASEFEGGVDVQLIKDPHPTYPDVKELLPFLDRFKISFNQPDNHGGAKL